MTFCVHTECELRYERGKCEYCLAEQRKTNTQIMNNFPPPSTFSRFPYIFFFPFSLGHILNYLRHFAKAIRIVETRTIFWAIEIRLVDLESLDINSNANWLNFYPYLRHWKKIKKHICSYIATRRTYNCVNGKHIPLLAAHALGIAGTMQPHQPLVLNLKA